LDFYILSLSPFSAPLLLPLPLLLLLLLLLLLARLHQSPAHGDEGQVEDGKEELVVDLGAQNGPAIVLLAVVTALAPEVEGQAHAPHCDQNSHQQTARVPSTQCRKMPGIPCHNQHHQSKTKELAERVRADNKGKEMARDQRGRENGPEAVN
jgi:hypothetical protein